jgi:hypothetical protein
MMLGFFIAGIYQKDKDMDRAYLRAGNVGTPAK